MSGTSCGAAVLALSQCEQFACEEADCPGGGDGPNLPGILACEKAAGNTVCKSYADAAACADALEADGGVAAACVDAGTTFAENAKAMVKLFCGGIFGDAGASDAGDGG